MTSTNEIIYSFFIFIIINFSNCSVISSGSDITIDIDGVDHAEGKSSGGVVPRLINI